MLYHLAPSVPPKMHPVFHIVSKQQFAKLGWVVRVNIQTSGIKLDMNEYIWKLFTAAFTSGNVALMKIL